MSANSVSWQEHVCENVGIVLVTSLVSRRASRNPWEDGLQSYRQPGQK